MKQAGRSLLAVTGLFILFMLQQLGWLDSILAGMQRVAWWVYLVVAGILFSGYQTVAAVRADREIDEQWNERQGEKYIQRMRTEREKRKKGKGSEAAH